LLVAVRQFRNRPRGDNEPQMPKWIATIDKTTPIAGTGISGGEQAIAYAVFALIGTVGVGTAVVIYFALGERSQKLLAGLKDWMTAHNAVIMSVLCLIIAAKLIGDGISGLAS
jgi:hypothetical protein